MFAVYSSFLQRAYDQLLHDVALSGLHVVFAVDRAGLVGADGATHHGVMDTVFLSGIPNMTVLCPASFAELRAMLRRGGEYRPTVLTFGDAALDCSTGMLSCAGQSVRLSGREFQVMELFLRAPKVVLSAERILERVWGWDSDAEINVVWVHISNLRKKLKGIGSTVTIRANRGLGYVLEAGDD